MCAADYRGVLRGSLLGHLIFQAAGLDLLVADPRTGVPPHHVMWEGDQGQTGWFIHGYQSLWIPQTPLGPTQQARLVEALFTATRN